MSRTLSQLIYSRIQTESTSPRIITLHKYNQRAGDVAEYGIAASPTGRVIGLESFKGVFVGKEITGYTWFLGPYDRPSPLFFGDALAEIEKFLWDEIDRQDGPDAELPFLVGVEQGAIIALAAAAAVPDLLSGVIAIGGSLPIVPGWSPPLAPLENLPILVIDTPETPAANDHVLAGESLADTLRSWGGNVTTAQAGKDEVPAKTMSEWVSTQPIRYQMADVATS